MPLVGFPDVPCQLILVVLPLGAGSRILLVILGTVRIALVLRGLVHCVGSRFFRLRVTVFAGVLVPQSFCLRVAAYVGVPVVVGRHPYLAFGRLRKLRCPVGGFLVGGGLCLLESCSSCLGISLVPWIP